ncbi:MAG: carboxypeptidase-like regulatory domain-containing protein [Planctomycetota bacterium]
MLTREGAQHLGPIGPQGHYSLAGVEPGTWSVGVHRSGYRQLEAELTLTLDEPIVRRDFALEPSWLLVVRIVTPAGESYGEAVAARARATGQSTPLPMAVATKEAPAATIPGAEDRNGYAGDGIYHTWDGLGRAAGEPVLEVLADPPAYVSLVLGETVLATQLVEAGAEEVRFVLDPEASGETTARIRLRLVSSADRRPVERADIEIGDSMFMARGAEWSETFAPGEYKLAMRSFGYASVFHVVTLEAGEVLDLGDIELEPEVTIAGRLADGNGRPVVGALEVGSRDKQGRLRFVENYHYAPDEDGNFVIHGLTRGQYVLRSAPEREPEFIAGAPAPERWVLPHTPISTLGGSVEGLELTLVRAGFLELRGMSKWPEGSQCKLLDAAGDLAVYDGFYPGYTPRFALPPGNYSLIVCDRAWQELRRFPVEIDASVVVLDVGE